MAEEGFAVRERTLPAITYEDGHFGISVGAETRWTSGGLPCDGLWHAVLASVISPEVTDIEPVSKLPSLLGRLLTEDPEFAIRVWQSVVADEPLEPTPQAYASLGDVARKCGTLMAGAAGLAVGLSYAIARGALHSSAVDAGADARPPSTELAELAGTGALGNCLPLTGAIACGALELATMARLYAAKPTETDALALPRAQRLSAYALLLPSLTAEELRLLMSTLGPDFAELNVFEVAAAVQFRLNERPTPMTPSGAISRIKWQKLLRKTRRRVQRQFHFEAPDWVQALDTALQLAHGANLLTPYGNIVQEAHAWHRLDEWRAECDAFDAEALAKAQRQLAHVAGEPVPVAERYWATRESATSPSRGGLDLSTLLLTAVISQGALPLSKACVPGRSGALWLAATSASAFGLVGATASMGRQSAIPELPEPASIDLQAQLVRRSIEQRPLHHLSPPQDGKTLVQADIPVTLEQMLNMVRATDTLAASAHVMDKHVKQAYLAIEKQMEVVLRKQGVIVFGPKTALPWGAKVEVVYSRRGRSPDAESFTFSIFDVRETMDFTVRDIALGGHYGYPSRNAEFRQWHCRHMAYPGGGRQTFVCASTTGSVVGERLPESRKHRGNTGRWNTGRAMGRTGHARRIWQDA